MKLPAITHLQFAVLDFLSDNGRFAKELSMEVAFEGIDCKGPKFYQLMKRLQEGGYVSAATKTLVAGGDRTFYKITAKGKRAFEYAIEFYVARS